LELGISDPGDCPGSTPPLKYAGERGEARVEKRGITRDRGKRCLFNIRFSFSHTAFEAWLSASMGIVLFVIFGSEKSIYTRWYLVSFF
jgi:hypothetical protein